MENGVWRTVGGRRIFIKEGQDLATAMKESGKFEDKKNNKQELADKSVLLKSQREQLRDKLNKGGLDKEEYDKIKEEIKKITEEKKEIDKNLTDKDLQEARHRLEAKKYKNNNKISKEEEIYNNLVKENDKNLKEELKKQFNGIEKYENNYGIDQSAIDDITANAIDKINKLHENNEISDYVYEKYIDNVNKIQSDILSQKGYESYEHNGKMYYSMLPKAKKAYNEILNELDSKKINYKISKSWNPGELPSIYVEDNDGNKFRIANHFNNKNQQFEAFSSSENKIYSTKDYINYKETVLKDLEEFLK